MKQLNQMLQQAQQMQKKMEEIQESLENIEVEGNAGAGMVVATLNGKSEVKKIKISPEIVNPDDIEILEDLIIAAINDAKIKAEQLASTEMSKMTGGMKFPGGMSLPF